MLNRLAMLTPHSPPLSARHPDKMLDEVWHQHRIYRDLIALSATTKCTRKHRPAAAADGLPDAARMVCSALQEPTASAHGCRCLQGVVRKLFGSDPTSWSGQTLAFPHVTPIY